MEFPLTLASGDGGLIEDALDRLLPGRFIPTPGVMFRKEVFIKVGGFDEHLWYCEDYDLWLRLAAATKVVATAKCLGACFRENKSLSSQEQTPVASEAGVYILKKVIDSDLFDERAKQQAALRLGKNAVRSGLLLPQAWSAAQMLRGGLALVVLRRADWRKPQKLFLLLA